MAGGYQHNPKGSEGVAKRIREIEAELRRLRAAITGIGIQIDPDTNTLVVPAGRSIRLDGGDMVADGGDVVSGNFVHGSTGFKLDGTSGTPEFNDLILRGGIIGNDALTAPVSPKVAHAQASNFSLTTTATQKVDLSIAVPTGYTQAIALATISATAVNTTSAQDTFCGYADVDYPGSPGGFLAAADGAPNYAIGIAHTETALPTGLSGTLHFRAMLQSLNAPWSANAFNTVNLDALVLFLR